MPLELTPEQQELMAQALPDGLQPVGAGLKYHPLMYPGRNSTGRLTGYGSQILDALAPVVAQLLADERERIAREIESRRTRFMPGLVEQGVFAYNDAARIARGQA